MGREKDRKFQIPLHQQTIKLINQGFKLGMEMPLSFEEEMKFKLENLARNTRDETELQKWKAISLGFNAAFQEKQKIRKKRSKELKQQKTNTRSISRIIKR